MTQGLIRGESAVRAALARPGLEPMRALLDYWQERCAGRTALPRDDLDPEDLVPLLPRQPAVDQHRPGVFRINNSEGYGKAMIGLFEEMGVEKVSILFSDKEATSGMAKYVETHLKEAGVEVALHEFDGSTTDFKPILNNVKLRDRPDAVAMIGYENDCVGVLRAGTVLKPEVKAMVGVWSLATSQMNEEFHDLVQNVYGTSLLPYPVEFQGEEAQAFAAKYEELHGKKPDYLGQFGYVSLLAERTWTIVERGVVLIPEGRLVFPDMSVLDNLMMGAFPRAGRAHWKASLEKVYALFPRLAERRGQQAGSLSGGEAQMLAIGRGLMERPRVLLIDEPSLGLAPVVVDEIFRILAGLKEQGLTIVLVEQNTARALRLADEVRLLSAGRVLLSRPAAEVGLEELHDLYFAREAGPGGR